MKHLIFCALAVLLASCSKKLTVQYQEAKENTGTITLEPAKPTRKTTVIVNDSLVVRKKKVKRVTITNVPIGTHVIQYTVDNSDYQYPLDSTFTINMEKPRSITKPVKVPPYSTGYYVARALGSLTAVIIVIFLL